MEEGERNLVIRENHYTVKLSIEVGGKEDQGLITSSYLMCPLDIDEGTNYLSFQI
jgi:hypothetical protein